MRHSTADRYNGRPIEIMFASAARNHDIIGHLQELAWLPSQGTLRNGPLEQDAVGETFAF